MQIGKRCEQVAQRRILDHSALRLIFAPVLPVLLSAQVAGEDFPDVFFGLDFFSPHGHEGFLAPFALQVENVVVLQIAKGRRRGIAPSGIVRGHKTSNYSTNPPLKVCQSASLLCIKRIEPIYLRNIVHPTYHYKRTTVSRYLIYTRVSIKSNGHIKNL